MNKFENISSTLIKIYLI